MTLHGKHRSCTLTPQICFEAARAARHLPNSEALAPNHNFLNNCGAIASHWGRQCWHHFASNLFVLPGICRIPANSEVLTPICHFMNSCGTIVSYRGCQRAMPCLRFAFHECFLTYRSSSRPTYRGRRGLRFIPDETVAWSCCVMP